MRLDPKAIGRDLPPSRFVYDTDQVLLYNLSCGAEPSEEALVLRSKGPKPLWSYPAVIAGENMLGALQSLGGDLTQLLHAAQSIRLFQPLPDAAEMEVSTRATGLYERGPHAMAELSSTARLVGREEPVFETIWTFFLKNHGGFGGAPYPKADRPQPEGPPVKLDTPTQPNQALLYQLNGDRNPLHTEPMFAELAGFSAPILHGLCSFGFAARAAMKYAGLTSPERVRFFSARFTQPVYPGETLSHSFWPIAEGQLRFQSKSPSGRGPCLSDGEMHWV